MMEGAMHGSITGSGMPKTVAKDFVEKTPSNKRKAFSKHLRNRRKKS